MKVILFLLLGVFITSCDPPYIEENHYLNRVSLARSVTNQTMVQLKKEKELYPCGIGYGGTDHIRMLALCFNYYKEANIDQARELLMEAGGLYLRTINGTEQIRRYLKNDPFQPENIQIMIYLYDSNGSNTASNKLAVITLIDGILKYKVRDPEKGLTNIYEESYEEAAMKLGTVTS